MLLTSLSKFLRLISRLRLPQSLQQQRSASPPSIPNAFTSVSPASPDIETIKSVWKDSELSDQPKPPRNHGHLDMSFFDDVDGWRGFIASIPGRKFDGVDLQATGGATGEISIAAAYGVTSDGQDRKRYTTDMRSEIEAIVAAQSSNVTSITG